MEDAVCDPLEAASRQELGAAYQSLTFLATQMAAEVEERRAALLAKLNGGIEIGCGGSKLDMRRLSPGCRLCVEGYWSCLFINGRCNADCFYCPTGQDETGLPTTNSIRFQHPSDYAEYLEHFGFRGASFSGGEPLLTPGRTLAFLRTVKRRFGARLHTWLYTNGTLLKPDLVLQLRDAGLDEIRFDIGAIGYSLKPAAMAVGVIPTVTVEIPAVPEEGALLREKLIEMANLGVDHLNLHQLRVTPYNLPKILHRGYTFLHGEKVTILESELTALELLVFGKERGIDLPINYCSFVYKNRYQKVAARRRGAEVMAKPFEAITGSGHIRTLGLVGSEKLLQKQVEQFLKSGATPDQFSLQASRERLFFSPDLWSAVLWPDFDLAISYGTATIRTGISYRVPFSEFRFKSGRKVFVERGSSGPEIVLSGDDVAMFERQFLRDVLPAEPFVVDEQWAKIKLCERIPQGLQVYG